MRIQSVDSIYTVRIIISEILSNYIDNAIKYTNKGYVEVIVNKNKDGSSVTFAVIDTGNGIGTSDKQRIFSKYYRSEDYLTEQTKGIGLGLYIVRKLSDSIGGKVWFESEINRGSTFYLEVPLSSQNLNYPKPKHLNLSSSDN